MIVGIIENPDRSIKIVVPALGFTVQDNFDRMGETGFIMDSINFPQEEAFRDAWVVDSAGTGIETDLERAKTITIKKVAKPYDKGITAISLEIEAAQDDGDPIEEGIQVTERKELRNEKRAKIVEIEACTTEAELAVLLP